MSDMNLDCMLGQLDERIEEISKLKCKISGGFLFLDRFHNLPDLVLKDFKLAVL